MVNSLKCEGQVLSLFKINNKDTTVTSMTLLWSLEKYSPFFRFLVVCPQELLILFTSFWYAQLQSNNVSALLSDVAVVVFVLFEPQN